MHKRRRCGLRVQSLITGCTVTELSGRCSAPVQMKAAGLGTDLVRKDVHTMKSVLRVLLRVAKAKSICCIRGGVKHAILRAREHDSIDEDASGPSTELNPAVLRQSRLLLNVRRCYIVKKAVEDIQHGHTG